MKQSKERAKKGKIESAALEVLAEKGYRSTSMLQIAKHASTSNQTLYAWYGNKQNLFQSIIEINGKEIKEHLTNSLKKETDPLKTLRLLGPLLLQFITTEKAIIINRAAIADASETGILAEAIQQYARQEMVDLISSLMKSIIELKIFKENLDPEEITEIYISLLFGEVQMLQVMGQLAPLNDEQILYRAERAFDLTCQLYAVDTVQQSK